MNDMDDIEAQIEETREKIKEIREEKQEVQSSPQSSPEPGDVPGVERAAVVETKDGNQRGIVCLFDDGHCTACVQADEKGQGACYTSSAESSEDGDHIFYLASAFSKSLGYNLRPVEGEEIDLEKQEQKQGKRKQEA